MVYVVVQHHQQRLTTLGRSMARFAIAKTLLGGALVSNTAWGAHEPGSAAAAKGIDPGIPSVHHGKHSVLKNTAGNGVNASDTTVRQPSPFNTSCPYVIPTEDEALSRGGDPSVPGNTVDVVDIKRGRLGNLFVGLSNVFRLGYCCKSKMVSLPPKSNKLAPGIFNKGSHGPRWFDFSDAPDVVGFNFSTCPSSLTLSGGDAYWLGRGLKECIQNAPRLTGCEAAHYLPADINVCTSNNPHFDDDKAPNPDLAPSFNFSGTVQRPTAPESVTANDGNLVIHVRSGDIFAGHGPAGYGQPPLQYYVRMIEEYDWSRVDVVTNGINDENPIVPALESKVAQGELSGEIFFHKDRSIAEDLVSMLCADGLATARSTITLFTSYHSTATRIFFPSSCARDRYAKAVKHRRPAIKAYGMLFDEGSYGPYHGWSNSEEQRAEMLEFEVFGFEECGPDSTE